MLCIHLTHWQWVLRLFWWELILSLVFFVLFLWAVLRYFCAAWQAVHHLVRALECLLRCSVFVKEKRRKDFVRIQHADQQFSLPWIILIRGQFTNHFERFHYVYNVQALKKEVLWGTFEKFRCKTPLWPIPLYFLEGEKIPLLMITADWHNQKCFYFPSA